MGREVDEASYRERLDAELGIIEQMGFQGTSLSSGTSFDTRRNRTSP